MNTNPKTIIQAFVRRDGTIDIESIHLFVVEFAATLGDAKAAMGAAFKDWYMKSDDGRDYVDDEGNNWGDAFEIPDGILKKHGIEAYYPLVTGNGKSQINQIEFDNKIVVDHDEPLFDIGIADDEQDGKI